MTKSTGSKRQLEHQRREERRDREARRAARREAAKERRSQEALTVSEGAVTVTTPSKTDA
jgi:hypothetical protein